MVTAEEAPKNANQEARGTGVNTNIYWVCTNILGDWVQLPEASPEQIMVARMVKHTFTGNLNATLDSFPPFPGKERHFLRC